MASGDAYAVVGGEGFVGHALVLALHKKYPGSPILSLDLVQRHYPAKGEWQFAACDLTDTDSLTSALQDSLPQGSTLVGVIHTASPFIGSPKELCEKVNVRGTANIVLVCSKLGVKKLVYTSSAGIPYDGNDLINVDERCTAPAKALDPYNETKAKAEAIALGANGKNGMLTCSIRPAGIFGPGDRYGIPGFIKAYKNGKTKFTIGGGQNTFDWTYIDNIVHAHLLAMERLGESVPISVFNDRVHAITGSLPRRTLPTSVTAPLSRGTEAEKQEMESAYAGAAGPIDPALPASRNRFDQFFRLQHIPATDIENGRISVAGQAFFITNGEPVSFWSWARAIWYEYAGHESSMINLPLEIGLVYARVENAISWVMRREPTLPVAAVHYSGARRFYNIEKARRVLGYEPVVSLTDGLKESIRWFKANEAEIEAQDAAAASAKKA